MRTLIATIKRLVRRARGLLRRVRPWPLRLLVSLGAGVIAVLVVVKLWLPLVILLATAAIAGALISRAKLAGTILVAGIGALLAGLVLHGLPALAVTLGAVAATAEQRQVAFQRPGGGQPLGAPQPAKAPIWARIPGRTK